MPEYYNLTQFGDQEGLIGSWTVVSNLTGGWFGVFLVAVVFVIPMVTMIRRGEEPNLAIHLSSLYAGIVAIVLFLGQVVTSSIVVLIPALTYAVTLGIRWYNKY